MLAVRDYGVGSQRRDLFRELRKHLEQSWANLHNDLAKAASKTVMRWCTTRFGNCGVFWVAFGHRMTLAHLARHLGNNPELRGLLVNVEDHFSPKSHTRAILPAGSVLGLLVGRLLSCLGVLLTESGAK